MYPMVNENEINSSDDWVNDKVIRLFSGWPGIRVFCPVPGFHFPYFIVC